MDIRTITITGRGSVSVKPDITRVNLTISALRTEYIDSYKLAQEYNARLKAIMKRLDLDETLPKTKRFYINRKTKSVYVNKHYDHEEFVGYELDQLVTIDIGMNNLLLGNLLSALGTDIPGSEISLGYTVSDPKQAQYDLLEDATRDAREKAERMVRAAGSELGDLLSIDYSVKRIDIYREEYRYRNMPLPTCAGPMDAAPLDIQPEDIEVSDDVTIVWSIKER